MTVNRRRFLSASALAGTLVATAATSAAAAPARDTGRGGPRVTTGADRLAADGWRRLAGRRVGVLSNPTGVLADQIHVVDSLVQAGLDPVAVFGPEHGFRGSAQAGGSEGDYPDPRTGVPVYDIYGVDVDKLTELLRKADVETLVFDIADVGARFYTYIWSMYQAMVASARLGIQFVVLDRPNPIGGEAHGPMLDPAYSSFVGLRPIVQQHGMTVGELARYFAAELLPGDGVELAELDVVPMRGWRRKQVFEDTGLLWTPPSPNMPTPDTASVYPGTCLFEGTVFSEGRGTTRPFEILGAPGVDWRWHEEIASHGLPGVSFRECYYVPTFGKFAGETCGGVQLTVTDPYRFDAIRTGVDLIVTAKRLYPDLFGWREDDFIDKLTGSDRFRSMVDAGATTDDVVSSWRDELADFRRKREPYLLYR
ncbi:exo-beta-N-acetylmuramidase NamZ family protein [Saccharomonospora azurea]